MLAETDRRNCLKPGDDVLQQLLAIDERRFGEVVALAVQQIEEIVPKALSPAGFQVGLEMPFSSSTMISPSISAELSPRPASASAMLRKRAVQSSALRVRSRVSRPLMRAWIR